MPKNVSKINYVLPSVIGDSITLNTQVGDCATGRLYQVKVVKSDKHLPQLDSNNIYIKMDSPTSYFFDIKLGDKKLGHLFFRSDEPAIDYVENSVQGEFSHVGMALTEFAARLVLNQGKSSLHLKSKNLAATFYFKLGFRFKQKSENEKLKWYFQHQQYTDQFGDMSVELKTKQKTPDSPRLLARIVESVLPLEKLL